MKTDKTTMRNRQSHNSRRFQYLSITDRTSREKINKDIENLNIIIINHSSRVLMGYNYQREA